MKRILHKFIASAIMLIALQNTLTAQPVGSQIKTDTSGHISYWNGVDAWVAIAPGLPGQTLKFTAGVPSWVNNPNGITTTAVSNITGNTALSGGNIMSDGGAKITARGVCWSTSPNPTITDAHTTDGTGIGSFTCNYNSLIPVTTYYIRAYATNSVGTAYGNEIILTTITLPTDFDGNTYNTVGIGTQIWMKQNLKTTHYKNGAAIPNITDNATWSSLSTGARCYYNNDPVSYASTYGALYNCYAVNTGNLCPTGWHVSNAQEWYSLQSYLGNNGDKLKEAGLAHWIAPNTYATNETGFTGLPAGLRSGNDGSYGLLGSWGGWWTTNANAGWAQYYALDSQFSTIGTSSDYMNRGFSVRCLKD